MSYLIKQLSNKVSFISTLFFNLLYPELKKKFILFTKFCVMEGKLKKFYKEKLVNIVQQSTIEKKLIKQKVDNIKKNILYNNIKNN